MASVLNYKDKLGGEMVTSGSDAPSKHEAGSVLFPFKL